MLDEVMSEPPAGTSERPKRPLIRAQLGPHKSWSFTAGRLFWIALLGLVLFASAWVVWQEERLISLGKGYLTYGGNVGLAVVGVLLGVALAPTQDPPDYSEHAAHAVDELADLIRATNAMVQDLADLADSDEVPDSARYKLVSLQEELRRHRYEHEREIARWEGVAPGTADAIIEKRRTTDSILRKIDEGYEA